MPTSNRHVDFNAKVIVYYIENESVTKREEDLKNHSNENTLSSARRILLTQKLVTHGTDIDSIIQTLAACKSLSAPAKEGWLSSIDSLSNKLNIYKESLGENPNIALMMQKIAKLRERLQAIPLTSAPISTEKTC